VPVSVELPDDSSSLYRIIHVKLNRMGRHAETRDLLHLEFDIRINQVIVKDTAGFQEAPVSVQRFERLVEAGANRRNVFDFLARQIEILELKGRIQSEVKSEMDKTQREYILREQLKAIQQQPKTL